VLCRPRRRRCRQPQVDGLGRLQPVSDNSDRLRLWHAVCVGQKECVRLQQMPHMTLPPSTARTALTASSLGCTLRNAALCRKSARVTVLGRFVVTASGSHLRPCTDNQERAATKSELFIDGVLNAPVFSRGPWMSAHCHVLEGMQACSWRSDSHANCHGCACAAASSRGAMAGGMGTTIAMGTGTTTMGATMTRAHSSPSRKLFECGG
jgi:hypothetical protein